ncbi:MAG: hypothetical protein AB4372_36745 [Xenococcus sp. (in: cyanobacteria)]
MPENAIDRLKNRERKKVTKRNASLNQDLDQSNDSNEIKSNNKKETTEVSNSVIESNSQNQIKSLPTLDQKPIRRTIRLDPAVDELIDDLCKGNKVTRDTLFESAILVCSQNQKVMKKVLAEAQERYLQRKRVGELKKINTMSQKYKDFNP